MTWRGATVVQALEAAGIATEKENIDNVDKMRCGILVGTAMGGMATFAQAIEDLTQKVHLTHVVQVSMCMFAQAMNDLT